MDTLACFSDKGSQKVPELLEKGIKICIICDEI